MYWPMARSYMDRTWSISSMTRTDTSWTCSSAVPPDQASEDHQPCLQFAFCCDQKGQRAPGACCTYVRVAPTAMATDCAAALCKHNSTHCQYNSQRAWSGYSLTRSSVIRSCSSAATSTPVGPPPTITKDSSFLRSCRGC